MKTKKQLQEALDHEAQTALRWWSKLQRCVTAMRKSLGRQRRLSKQLEQIEAQRKARRAGKPDAQTE